MNWQEREGSRFSDGTYRPVPVNLPYPIEHYLHLSLDSLGDPTMVAYTPSEEYGNKDRQIKLKFGRYLKKTFPELSDQTIQEHVTTLKSKLALLADQTPILHFATDIPTINAIFETAMYACGSSSTSCMHGKFDCDTIRPYHVYADSPDVAVAYVTVDAQIVSRTVVSTKDSEWVRLYSRVDGDNDTDCGTLKSLLIAEGYSKGDLVGNRLTKLKTREVMLPYVDNLGMSVKSRNGYWVICNNDDYETTWECNCTDGSATAINQCGDCNKHISDCNCDRCSRCSELMSNCDCVRALNQVGVSTLAERHSIRFTWIK